MADMKKVGEKADQMIAEQNRLRAEAAAAMAAQATQELENRPPAEPATPAEVVPAVTQDAGVATPSTPAVITPELETLREQVRVADQRWQVLQGMVNKKDQEIENMRTLLAQLSQKKDEAPTTQAQSPATVSAQDVDDFGQDLIDLITKISRNTAAALLAQEAGKIESQVSELKKSVTGLGESTARTAAEMFDEALTRRVPNWRQVNVDPGFLLWTDTVDDFTGVKLVDLLQDAYTRMDLPRTAKFFERFLEGKAPAAPAELTKTADVTKLVTPSKSRTAAPNTTAPETKVWTQADIAKLYSDRRTGKITKEESDKQEADLYAAMRENRIAA